MPNEKLLRFWLDKLFSICSNLQARCLERWRMPGQSGAATDRFKIFFPHLLRRKHNDYLMLCSNLVSNQVAEEGGAMANVHDVAQYILDRTGEITTWKLQKLVYYSQAWSLVWDEKPLFPERIEAWANGPVVPDLYQQHRGSFTVSKIAGGNPKRLDQDGKETVDAVLKYYGHKSSQWLSDLTHREAPWLNARKGLPDGDRGNSVITHGALADYYGNL